MDANKLFGNLFIGLGLIAFVIYLSLNSPKLLTAYGNAQLFMSGRPADELTLESKDGTKVKVPLPSSDLFQRVSNRQISFFRIDEGSRSRLFGSSGNIIYRLNGKQISIQPVTNGDYTLLPFSNRLLYIIPAQDLKDLAEITSAHRNEPAGILKCRGALCVGLSVELAGVGALEGPYSPIDQIPMRRGLPLGQWIKAPELNIMLSSSKSASAELRLTVLIPFEEIKPAIQGPILQARIVAGNREPAQHEFPLRRYDLEMVAQLSKGLNHIQIKFDRRLKANKSHGDTEQVRAGYLIGIEIVELSVPKP